MATGGPNNCSVLCHFCNKFIQVYNGDVQLSMEIHWKQSHPSSDRPTQNYKKPFTDQRKNVNPGNKNSEMFFCPVCKKSIEISKNNFNQCIQEHFDSHNQTETKSQTGDQLYTFTGIKNWIEDSNKSERSDRSSSDFRSNKNPQHFERGPFNRLPGTFKQQRGYIVDQGDNNVFCNVCTTTLESTYIVDHLKTKTHEDNVILHVKGKFPTYLQNSMEFISFYNSTLCCNLCRCKINLNSCNIFETMFNIISHNADISHSSQRTGNESSSQSDTAFSLLNSLAGKYPLINDNKTVIEKYMEPQFKCKLCDKSILYADKEHILAQNFIRHFNSAIHKKSEKAVSMIESLNTSQGFHRFVVSSGNITCIPCKFKVEPDINKLLVHINEVSQPNQQRNQSSYSTQSNQSPKSFQSASGQKQSSYDSASGYSQNSQTNNNTGNTKFKKINLKQLLIPLQQEFGNIDCIQNVRGQIKCTICDCSLPPTTGIIKMHLIGNHHKNQAQSQNQQFTFTSNNKDKGKTSLSDNIEKLFQTLPQKFHEDKKFIRDSPIDGYIVCSLCDCVINPHYFRNHLLDENHIQKKKYV